MQIKEECEIGSILEPATSKIDQDENRIMVQDLKLKNLRYCLFGVQSIVLSCTMKRKQARSSLLYKRCFSVSACRLCIEISVLFQPRL